MDGLKLALLGKFQASFGDKALPPFRTSKVQALLIYLVVEAIAADAEHNQTRTSHRREALMELLWPNLELRAAQGNLRQALYQLRKAVPDQQTGDGAPLRFLDSSRLAVSINPSYQFTNDVAEFISHLHKERLEAAVDLYRGDFLSDFYLTDSNDFEEWAQVHRNSYRQQAINALERLAVASLADGRYEKVLQYAGQQLAIDDLNEGAYRQMMEAQARLGKRQAALASYETLRQKLDDELGVEPSLELEQLLARIQNDEIRAVDQEKTRPTAPQIPQIEEEEVPLFVGRETELDQLTAALQKVNAGQGALQFIIGGAGRGKTALVTAFAGRALGDNEDLLLLSGQCRGLAGMGEPYLPFRHILDQLTGDVSSSAVLSRQQAHRFWEAIPDTIPLVVEQGGELIDALLPGSELRRRAATISSAQTGWFRRLNERLERSGSRAPQKEQLFSQVTAVLKAVASKRPLLLVIEDLHWLDAASAGLLFHLSFELANSRILLLGTYRPEEVRKGDDHPLARFESELKRQFGDIWLDLSEKDEIQGRSFIDAYLDSEANALDKHFRQELFAHTGGHALFTVELLRALQDRGDLYRDEGGLWQAQSSVDWQALPVRVEGVIEQRFGRLDPDLQDALSVAAVQGERFTVGIAAEIAGLDERDLVRRLSREVEKQHRLVAAEGLSWQDGRRLARYRFRHQLFQQYLYGELPEGERIYLHESVGLKLEALAEDTKPLAAELAWHFDQAGDDEKALSYLLQAGDTARLLYATEESVAHYERALAILKEQGNYEEASHILMKLGLTHSNAFDFGAAQKAYDESFALRRQAQPDLKQSELPSSEYTLPLADEPHPPGLGPIKPGVAVPDLPPAPHALRVPNDNIPESFELKNHNQYDYGLFPGLVKLNLDLDVVPDVAQRWDILEDGRVYLFHLREDAVWSDGRSVTAHDFVFAWQRVLAPHANQRYAEMLFDIAGARAYHQGASGAEARLGLEVLDDHTLRVTLEHPVAHFLHILAQSVATPIPQHVVEVYGDAWDEPEHVVTCGPFVVQSRNEAKLVLRRNPTYFGEFEGNIERVEINAVPDPADQMSMYVGNRLDLVFISPMVTPKFSQVVEQYADEYDTNVALFLKGFVFNINKPPFDDLRVRQAFVLATDRHHLVNAHEAESSKPCTGGVVPPDLQGHVPDIALPYDPEKARKLLAEAGYPDGRGFPHLNVILTFWDSHEPAFVLEPWQEILGVELSWKMIAWGDYFDCLAREQPHIHINFLDAEYPDPDSYLRVGLRWMSSWHHDSYDELVEEAKLSQDHAYRMELFRQAEKILVQEAPILPLVYLDYHRLVKPWIKNNRSHPLMRPSWHKMIMEPH